MGKLKYCVPKWQRITRDPAVLEAVTGYCINFDQKPFQTRVPSEINFNSDQWQIVDEEVSVLLQKGAIVESSHETDEFISTIFIVAKPNGKYRPVINLRFLNEFVHYDHFKQETFKVVLELLQENDFMASIDLRDAYFSVPIHSSYQKYLKFSWNGILYKFVCLPFGLRSAPFLYTKILKPVYAFFRQQNIRCSYYIDDSLDMNKDSSVCRANTVNMINTLEGLGFTINWEKSVLVPTQRIKFFGFIIDSVQFKIFLTEEKVQKVFLKAGKLMENGVIVIRELASFIGLVINAFHAVLQAPMHYRDLERDKIRGLGSSMDFDNTIVLSRDGVHELQWWLKNIRSCNGKDIRPKPVNITCRTDASLLGWGGVDISDQSYANGRWNVGESENSINFLELKAMFYTLQSLYDSRCDVHIEIQSDNVCAVTYVNDMGGMTSKKMDRLSSDIWNWCIQRRIYLSAVYIPGILNTTADYYSRNFSNSTEWMLKHEIFLRLGNQFFMPDVDLFASRLNRQVEHFVSWFAEPGALHFDAFTLCWQGYEPYIFPPFNMVGKVINKIVRDEVERAILIFPFWRSQPWFPLLLDCISSYPVRLPRHKDILCLPHDGSLHPLSRSLTLIGVEVSGVPCRTEAFHQELQRSSCVHGKRGRTNSTNMRGNSGVLGTILGLEIPVKRLKL